MLRSLQWIRRSLLILLTPDLLQRRFRYRRDGSTRDDDATRPDLYLRLQAEKDDIGPFVSARELLAPLGEPSCLTI